MNAQSSTAGTFGETSMSADVLDRPLAITLFTSYAATSKREGRLGLRALAERIRNTTAGRKDQLPWLKLAHFGEVRSDKNSLRHDANMLAISGIEADYDGERVGFDQATETLGKAGVLALVYTSPSHSEDAPRWRVLCPLSAEQPASERSHLLGRLNGLFGGIFSAESWALSQAYYYGSVNLNPSHRVEVLDGTPIDQLDELDAVWCGKPDTAKRASASGERPRSGPVDEAALLAQIVSGQNYHAAYVRLLGKWARDGVPFMDARRRVLDAMDAVPETERNARWATRRGDVDRCLEDIYGKEARARDERPRPHGPAASRSAGAAGAAANEDADPWPEPVDFLDDAALTGTPELRPEHLPAALHPFVTDTARRMGVDPVSVALSALVTCASMINEAWRIQPKQRDDTWTEAARLWGAIVGDPSIHKTPVIATCTRSVERLDAEARHRHAEQMRKHQGELTTWKAAGSDPTDMPRAPRLDRYLVEGTTVEALSEVLRDDAEAKQRTPTGRVLIRQDEMSEWLASFDRYRSGGRGGGDRGAYLRLYNGGRYVVDRVNRGTFAVSSWSACILGGIQPEPIQRIAREAADDGLLQRFIFCVPACQARGEDRAPDRAALHRYEALIPALALLHPPTAGFGGAAAGETTPHPIVLHAQAHPHRLAVDELVPVIAAMPDTSSRLKAALGKWPGLFARLALTFHLIEAADAHARDVPAPPLDVLPEGTASQVAGFMRDILLPHLLRAEAVMFSTAQTGHARWIAGFILSRGGVRVTLRDVVQAYGALRAPESRRELLEVMESLVSVGWLRPEPQPNPARPPAAWAVNPAVHATFAVRAAQEREARSAGRQRVSDGLAILREERP